MALKTKSIINKTTDLISTVLFLIVATLSSCMGFDNAFTRVSDYYSDDSLKHEAAMFLEKYAEYHYGIGRHIVDPAGKRSRLRPSDFARDSLYRAYLDSLNYTNKIGKPVMDIDTVTEDYLKENIDLALDSWHKPWVKDIPFDDFCHYILPYRNGDEELTRWRPKFMWKYYVA